MISVKDFFGYELFNIADGDLEVSLSTLGASVIDIKFKKRSVILGYENAQGYLDGDSYIGATVGRYANRIGGAEFSLNGVKYKLSANEGKNQLHGGIESLPYNKRRWTAEIIGGNSLRFKMISPDGDNGFPGNMEISVTYRVCGNCLRIDFEGVSDADTYFAPTNHTYFNLDGSGSVLSHKMRINADRYAEVDNELIPTGRLLPCEAGFDFSKEKPIAQDYDHAFVLNSSHACTLTAGGVELQLHTDFPALQFYTGSVLPDSFGKNRGLCIEPEFYPDSPNHPDFPSALLKAGDHFHRFAEYRFK